MKGVTTQKAVKKLHELSPLRPKLGVVLGTGFDQALSKLKVDRRLAYGKIPGFPSVGVTGHSGELVIGRLGGVPVIALRGRAHFYEGHPMATVTFPVRVLAAAGVRDLLLTNAAGGINPRLRPHDFMIIADHINFMGVNPLRGSTELDQKRFVDLSQVYDPRLRELLLKAGKKCGLRLRAGVYLAVSGPSYETPAEIRAFRRIGADAVGMSTVPEAVAARQCGLRIAAVSCITNAAAGLKKSTLSHREVLEASDHLRETAGKLLTQFAVLYGHAAKDSG